MGYLFFISTKRKTEMKFLNFILFTGILLFGHGSTSGNQMSNEALNKERRTDMNKNYPDISNVEVTKIIDVEDLFYKETKEEKMKFTVKETIKDFKRKTKEFVLVTANTFIYTSMIVLMAIFFTSVIMYLNNILFKF